MIFKKPIDVAGCLRSLVRDARDRTARGEAISEADFQALHTYIGAQARGRQAFTQAFDAEGPAGPQTAGRKHDAYARTLAAEAAARSAAAAGPPPAADPNFAADARQTADELQRQELLNIESIVAREGLGRPPAAASPPGRAAPAPTAAAAAPTLDTHVPAPLNERAFRRPVADAATAAAAQSGTGFALNHWVGTCFAHVAPQDQRPGEFPFLSPEAFESELNCSIRDLVRSWTTYTEMQPEMIAMLAGTPAAFGFKFHRAQLTRWGNAFKDAELQAARDEARTRPAHPRDGAAGNRAAERAPRASDHNGEAHQVSPSGSVGYTEAVASNKEVTPAHLTRLMTNPLYQHMETTVADKNVEDMARLLQSPHPNEDAGRLKEDYDELLPVLMHYLRTGKKGMTPTGASENLKRFHGFVAAFQGTMSQLAHGIVSHALPNESSFPSWERFSGPAAGSKAFTAGNLPEMLTSASKFSPAVTFTRQLPSWTCPLWTAARC